jgi:type IV pilus assembly protein PilB
LLLVDDEMRSMISHNVSQNELLRHATKLGYRSLRYDGIKKVLLGLTTMDEIEKHTVLEWDPLAVDGSDT